jgi:hypothetical protein
MFSREAWEVDAFVLEVTYLADRSCVSHHYSTMGTCINEGHWLVTGTKDLGQEPESRVFQRLLCDGVTVTPAVWVRGGYIRQVLRGRSSIFFPSYKARKRM